MFPKLDVEIRPGLGLGQFELGVSHFSPAHGVRIE